MSEWVQAGNRYLTVAEMKQNATYIWNYLSGHGWTKNAVAGMLGNMQSESSINPQIWQGLNANHAEPWGYGLVQWTPSTKLSDWAANLALDYTQMDTQLQRILYEVANGLQWGSTDAYPLSFTDFTQSTLTANYLGIAFLANYERPRIASQPWRGQQAETWYNYLANNGLPQPPAVYIPNTKMKLLYYMKRRIF
jgi:hypothetical protein